MTKKAKILIAKQQNLLLHLDKEYKYLFTEIKTRIQTSRLQAALAVNREVIKLYWFIGKKIIEKQAITNWGDKLLDTLCNDLRNSFPETHGFSKTNLKYMRIFAHFYPDGFGQQPVDQLPWGHITFIIRIKNAEERHWYVHQCLENGWSRDLLEKQIRSNLYGRQAISKNKTTNFLTHLPSSQSQLAHDIIKNPYNFDCLGLHDEALEREIEYASLQHISKFLIELGKGFAFLGNQVPIEINERIYFLDMLFYHVKLHAYIIVELKASAFKPEHAGKLNFYLSAVDDILRSSEDNPSIGLLLCKTSDKVLAEYALRGINKPIGVSEYTLTKAIPKNLEISLPSIKEIEAELSKNKKKQIW
jgi:predicted nuclease of restriction endonuclease-like (RecB) superfamily